MNEFKLFEPPEIFVFSSPLSLSAEVESIQEKVKKLSDIVW